MRRPPWDRLMTKFASVLRAAAAVARVVGPSWLAVIAAIFMIQDCLIFPGTARNDFGPARLPFTAETAGTPDGARLSFLATPPRPGMPVIIFFHGNGETAADGQEPMGLFAARGYGVVLAEFRGFGGSTGTPSEAGIIEDGSTEISWAARRWPGARQVLWGESIGTGVAVALAGETGPLAVVLDSPFTSIREVAVRKFPFLLVPLLLRHPFDSMARTGGVEAPVIVLTGNSDRVVPPDMGHAVLTALITSRPCQLAQGIFSDGGHMVERNDGTGRVDRAVLAFLGRVRADGADSCAPARGGH